eukprot:scaffold1272_cov250-Pinguiococcus_pyrenoidosus.AAC.75
MNITCSEFSCRQRGGLSGALATHTALFATFCGVSTQLRLRLCPLRGALARLSAPPDWFPGPYRGPGRAWRPRRRWRCSSDSCCGVGRPSPCTCAATREASRCLWPASSCTTAPPSAWPPEVRSGPRCPPLAEAAWLARPFRRLSRRQNGAKEDQPRSAPSLSLLLHAPIADYIL